MYRIYEYVYVQKPLIIITTMAIMNNDDPNTDNIYIYTFFNNYNIIKICKNINTMYPHVPIYIY